MPHSREQIAKMLATLDDWHAREHAVTSALFAYKFGDAVAREMMQHGFSRRVADLKHGLERVFEILPPEAEDAARDALQDATAFLQSFVINTFGAIDNLAWVWALESCAVNGGKLPDRGHIGLRPVNTTVRGSLSEATQDYLKGTDGWFGYHEEYRPRSLTVSRSTSRPRRSTMPTVRNSSAWNTRCWRRNGAGSAGTRFRPPSAS